MGIEPTSISTLLISGIVGNPESAIKDALGSQGMPDENLPTSWKEGGKVHVGSSSVRRIARSFCHTESSGSAPAKYNVEPPRPIIAAGDTVDDAWRNYAVALSNHGDGQSCIRLETPDGAKFARVAIASLTRA